MSVDTISDLHSSWDAVLKAQKPAWLTTVSLATISDLHSSWDALLKSAPTDYVTRWPGVSEVTGLQDALNLKLDAATFNDLFEKVEISTGVYAIRAKYGLYSNDWISAKGANPDAGGVVSGATDLDGLSDVTLTNMQNGQVLMYNGSQWVNSTLDVGLDETALAQYLTNNQYLTIPTGDGRYVKKAGDIMTGDLGIRSGASTIDGSVPYAGSAFASNIDVADLSNYKTILGAITMGSNIWYNIISIRHRNGNGDGNRYGMYIRSQLTNTSSSLLWGKQNGGTWGAEMTILDSSNYATILDTRYVKKSGDTMTGSLHVPILYLNYSGVESNIRSQNTSFLHYTTAASSGHWFNKNVSVKGEIYAGAGYNQKVWHAGNDGSGSGLDADTLDGFHANAGNAPYGKVAVVATDGVLEIGRYIDWHYSNSGTGDYSIRLQVPNVSNVWVNMPSASGTLARTVDNVYSATKLQTARKIWGQSFNGEADVSGALSDATTITASGQIQGGSFKLGNGTITWDSKNNCFHFSHGLYSDSFVSAKGANSGSGGTVGGVTKLSDLSDVQLGTLATNQVLSWNGSKWVNKAVSTGLDETALAQYLTNNQYLTMPTGDARYVTLATTQTISGEKTFGAPVHIIGGEANNIETVRNQNGSITTNRISTSSSIRNALSFKWYQSDWQIGNIRSGSVTSEGFGITKDNSNLVFRVNEYNAWVNGGVVLHTNNYTSYLDSRYLRTVSLTTISDLHSSWDALLKAAPSVYVTRWPTAAEVGALTQSTGDARYALTTGTNASGTWPISIKGDAQTFRGYGTNLTWGGVVVVRVDGVAEMGRHIDFHYADDDPNDYSIRLQVPNVSNQTVILPSSSGTIALTTSNVYSASKLQTSQKIWGQPFNGTAPVSGNMTGVGSITMNGAFVNNGGAIELYSKTPFIDFHYNSSTADYTSRLIAIGSNILQCTSNFVVGGNVGIGTVSPSYKLHVAGAGYFSGALSTSSSFIANSCIYSNEGWFQNKKAGAGLYNSAVDARWYANSTGWISDKKINATAGLAVTGAATFSSTITASGLITANGGLTTSQYIQIGSARLMWDSETGALYVLKSDGTACGFYATGFVSAKGANGDGRPGDLTDVDSLTFTPGASNRNLYFNASGMRIITTNSSNWATGISVYNNANTTKLGDVCGAYGGENSFSYSYFGGSYNSPGMVILPSNKYVGIGTTSPTYKLHVSGTAYATGGFQNGSDIRYKHVLQDLALTVAQVAAAPSFLFRWTDGTADGVQAGTSAQYWQQVMPQVVTESAGRLSMQYDKAALAAAITIARDFETLEQRVDRLEKENGKLKKKVKELERRAA